jgi:hypothetical protein
MEALTTDTFASLPITEQVARLEHVEARTRQELILKSRNSVTLTRALSSEKLFYILKEVGLADAVDLLALASPEQVRDMIDLDCWRKDTLDERRVTAWMMLLDEAGSGKLAEWALHTDIELLVLLVKRRLEVVRKNEVEEDPDFDQSKYFTFDDQYLLRFIGEGEPILSLVLERLRVLDYENYKQVLEWSLLELESTLEEDALHWRQARLADRGYPEYDEARKLFRFVTPESFHLTRYPRAQVSQLRYAEGEEVIPSDHALMLLEAQDTLLVRTLATLPAKDVEPIGYELAMLTNEVVIAEACDPGEVAEVRKCAEEVHDYINIGLAHFAQKEEKDASHLLQETRLRPFFQVGMSLTVQLQQRMQELASVLSRQFGASWEELIDSPFRESCVGAQRHPPVFFRGLETPGEIFFRRFQNLEEVKKVEAVLQQVPTWFAVMQRWQLIPQYRVSEQVSLAALWNTAFARWVIDSHIAVHPLTRSEFGAFQKKIQTSSLRASQEQFLDFATTQLSLSTAEDEALEALATFAGEKLEEALAVDAAVADPRFIEGILITH